MLLFSSLRLDAAAAQMVSEALEAAFDVPAERSVKRQRTMEVMPIAVAEKGLQEGEGGTRTGPLAS